MDKSEIFKDIVKHNRIVSLRMVTGEEVIARVQNVYDSYITIDQPRVLIAELRRKPDGTPFMAANILNWLNADPDNNCNVCYTDIVTIIVPDGGIESEYIRFTTGIELAESANNKIIT